MNSFKYIFFCILGLATFNGAALADTENIHDEILLEQQATAAIGYQSFSLDGNPGRAAEYRSLTSSPTLDLNYSKYYGKAHVDLDVSVLNDEDYGTKFAFEKGSQLRFSFNSERFIHNLDHIPYDNGIDGDGSNRTPDPARAAAEGSRPDGVFNGDIRTYYTDHDPGADYEQKIDINEVRMRAKLPSYPAHLNLSYWRLEKHGARQLRFVDENCTGCHMQSRTRQIDRVTDEIKAGIDTHLGYIDLSAEALHREFRDREDIPGNDFGQHFRGRDSSPPGYEHSEDPDSELTEFTLRANTSPSGGFVGSASFTLGERENNSDLTSISPVNAETDYYKTTADITYTPGKAWTVSMRYRLFDIDSSNSGFIYSYAGGDPELEVRDALDYQRAWYEAIVNYRPTGKLTLKAELRREDIDRSNTGPAQAHHSTSTDVSIDPYWELPEQETITRLKIGFHSRLLEKSKLKFSGWAMLKKNDDPAYGTSFAETRQLFFSSNYSPTPLWGLAASLDVLDEDNDDRTVIQLFNDDGIGSTPDLEIPYDLDRERKQQNFSLGTWLTPAPGLSFDMNYGYLHTDIQQDLLFGAEPNTLDPAANYTIEDDDVDYDQTVHTLSVGMTWQAKDNLSCRFEGYHIRSEASFDPDFALRDSYLNGAMASSDELRDISQIDIRQNGLKGRLNWKIDEDWSCTVQASYDDYDDKSSNVFDGSVTSYMASLSRVW